MRTWLGLLLITLMGVVNLGCRSCRTCAWSDGCTATKVETQAVETSYCPNGTCPLRDPGAETSATLLTPPLPPANEKHIEG